MFHRIGAAAFKKDLTNTIALCEHLNNPHRQFPSIHIAGTNGKGSTAHILAAIFTANGYKTGLYTSPHYRDFRERIKIDGHLIPKKEVTHFVKKHRAVFEEIKPSFFEWTVALAFDYFARQKVDIAIIETGLGGRLDSTNIITPLVSVITNIGYDHQQFLGETLPEIAVEKAGIIKPKVPVVIGETQPVVQAVFENKATEMQAPIFFADQHFQAILLEKSETHSFYRVLKNGHIIFEKIAIEHLADYQKKNLQTVLQTIELFSGSAHLSESFKLSERSISTGMAHLKRYSGFLGRWEFISQQPAILCDSAHNIDGIRLAMEGLKELKFNHLHIVFGMVKDKDISPVLSLLPENATYYFAKANIPRGLEAPVLQEKAAALGLHGKAYSSVRRALAAAKKCAGNDDLIFVGGSIFVVAEVI
ncbi:MAG: folylpolyglutamate synthase/dihydrofolate synthase family protein [Bacteroidota bacterium]